MNDIEALLSSLGIGSEESAEMNKQASADENLRGQTETLLTEDKSSMTKKAYEYGRELASAIIQEAGRLEKQANLMTDQNARIVAEQMQQVLPVPDGDIDEVTKGLIARARGAGAQDMDPDLESWLGQAAEGNSGGQIPDELRLRLLGSDEPSEDGAGKLIGTGPDNREIEKASSLLALIESGVPYDTAVHLVKTAAEQIDGYTDMEKAAAAIELMDSEGIPFAEAVELVKRAAEGESLMQHGKRVVKEKVRGVRESAGERAKGVKETAEEHLRNAKERAGEAAGKGKRGVVDFAKRHPKGLAGAAGAAAGLAAGAAGAAAHEHHKKAEMLTNLVKEGYSMSDAAHLVKNAFVEEVSEVEKTAAVLDLMNAGVSMEDAVASVARVTA
jgi:hypothetical protein